MSCPSPAYLSTVHVQEHANSSRMPPCDIILHIVTPKLAFTAALTVYYHTDVVRRVRHYLLQISINSAACPDTTKYVSTEFRRRTVVPFRRVRAKGSRQARPFRSATKNQRAKFSHGIPQSLPSIFLILFFLSNGVRANDQNKTKQNTTVVRKVTPRDGPGTNVPPDRTMPSKTNEWGVTLGADSAVCVSSAKLHRHPV